jgi:hypothetical protein
MCEAHLLILKSKCDCITQTLESNIFGYHFDFVKIYECHTRCAANICPDPRWQKRQHRLISKHDVICRLSGKMCERDFLGTH